MGVWIEILLLRLPGPCKNVAPFVGVWIEITNTRYPIWDAESLPSWECGLKLTFFHPFVKLILVAPFVGVWIEITTSPSMSRTGIRRSLRGSVD